MDHPQAVQVLCPKQNYAYSFVIINTVLSYIEYIKMIKY
jgi:hypothetical protein